jgi:hypothetical protein
VGEVADEGQDVRAEDVGEQDDGFAFPAVVDGEEVDLSSDGSGMVNARRRAGPGREI